MKKNLCVFECCLQQQRRSEQRCPSAGYGEEQTHEQSDSDPRSSSSFTHTDRDTRTKRKTFSAEIALGLCIYKHLFVVFVVHLASQPHRKYAEKKLMLYSFATSASVVEPLTVEIKHTL